MGEVITFAGLYRADRGQAAAVTFYTLVGKLLHHVHHESCMIMTDG
jgi:hypothetical protein